MKTFTKEQKKEQARIASYLGKAAGVLVDTISEFNDKMNDLYNEGIAVVKAPNIPFFGKDGYEVSFKGEQNVHVTKINVIAPANQLNSSSNPAYLPVSASTYAFDNDKQFVYITGINLHDDNMNVIMKAKLAQPILKRHGDRILFRISNDW